MQDLRCILVFFQASFSVTSDTGSIFFWSHFFPYPENTRFRAFFDRFSTFLSAEK